MSKSAEEKLMAEMLEHCSRLPASVPQYLKSTLAELLTAAVLTERSRCLTIVGNAWSPSGLGSGTAAICIDQIKSGSLPASPAAVREVNAHG